MGMALASARRALLAGEVPVGACLVWGERSLTAHNHVIAHTDPTAHAEMEIIRAAASQWPAWSAAESRLYVTVEPCPMCLGACHYAGIHDIVYAVSLADFHQLTGGELMAPLQGDATLTGACCRDESWELLQTWAARQAASA
jgi:tRNA(adenine34) deaminase